MTKSASSKTTYGSLPPNSSTVFFNTLPAVSATDFPAGVLPVKVTAAIDGSLMTSATSCPGMTKFRKIFSKNPESIKHFSMAAAHPWTFDACFKMAPFPAVKVGMANRKTCQNGKFHGMIPSTNPMG